MSETARWTGPAPPQQQRAQQVNGRADGANLADILERVLDKGIVIAGDIQVNLLDIELLTIKIRLVVASVERAKEMGIDWWERDPTLSAGRRELEDENKELRARVEALERGGRRESDELGHGRDDGDEPDDVAVGEPYEDEELDEVEDGEVGEVEDAGIEDAEVEDDHLVDLDADGDDAGGPDGTDHTDQQDGPADDGRPTRGNGRSGRAVRAKAGTRRGVAAGADDDAAAVDAGADADDGPDEEPARSRGGRGRARASDDAREAPARRKPGSKRSSRER